MKLTVGENIRNYRKKHDLTQEDFAGRLGVTVQSVSRWENGVTYPDLELLPAIAGLLSVTVDELLGIPEIEKEKRAKETFDELRRECLKENYDPNRITELLKDIRRNYLDAVSAWRPWVDGNDRAFRDPAVLPEVRLLAEAFLENNPMKLKPLVIRTMAVVEDEEHLEAFLDKYTTEFDCSRRTLMFTRHYRRRDEEKFELERQYQLLHAFNTCMIPNYLMKLNSSKEEDRAAYAFMNDLLTLIRRDAADDGPDMWTHHRLDIGFENAIALLTDGKTEEALRKVAELVRLLEETMKLPDQTELPASCCFLDGMVWRAEKMWNDPGRSPDAPYERSVYIEFKIGGLALASIIFPSSYWDILRDDAFDALRGNAEFEALCDRVAALIETQPKDRQI